MADLSIGRRHLLTAALSAGLFACSRRRSEIVCTDTAGLAKDDVDARETLQYVDRSPDPYRTCAKCTQFKMPPKIDTCGACGAFKGPISPSGTCKIFALRG